MKRPLDNQGEFWPFCASLIAAHFETCLNFVGYCFSGLGHELRGHRKAARGFYGYLDPYGSRRFISAYYKVDASY